MKFRFSPHVAVQVKNYPKAVEFYKNVLGMKQIKQLPSETELKVDNITFYVEDNPANNIFFEFATENLQEAKQMLEKAGCKLTQTQTPEGTTSYLVSDPFGFRFHLFQE